MTDEIKPKYVNGDWVCNQGDCVNFLPTHMDDGIKKGTCVIWADGRGLTNKNTCWPKYRQLAEHWQRVAEDGRVWGEFAGRLLTHCEGVIVSEEMLQSVLGDVCRKLGRNTVDIMEIDEEHWAAREEEPTK